MKILQLVSSCALGLLAVATIRSANAADLESPHNLAVRQLVAPSSSPAMRALATATTTTTPPAVATAKPKACRQYLTTQCSDSRPVCIKDCRDRLVQVLALQEAQDAYIATRGLEKDALGIYVDYREQQQKLTLDSLPAATEWLYVYQLCLRSCVATNLRSNAILLCLLSSFLSGLQLNGKLEYDFPEANEDDESASLLTSVILAGESVASIEKVNFPDQVTTMCVLPPLSSILTKAYPNSHIYVNLTTSKLVGTSLSNLVNARFPASLALLDVSSNQIESLSCCGFPDSLKELYLSYNALDRLENLVLPSALETLAVNWNAIAIIRNVTFPATLSKFYFVENPISLVSLAQDQWPAFLQATQDFVTLDGEPSVETSCVTGYFGAGKKHPFLACLLGEEPAYIENTAGEADTQQPATKTNAVRT